MLQPEMTPVTETPPENTLLYIRCKDCLSTYTVERTDVEEHFPCPFSCSCGGDIKVLGRVVHDSIKEKEKGTYEATKQRSICDGKCTSACGPLCNCTCGGAHHGSGIQVTVVVKQGRIHVKEVDEKALKNAAEWKDQLKAIETLMPVRFKEFLALKAQSTQFKDLPPQSWDWQREYYVAQKELKRVKSAHLHNLRTTYVTKFLDKWKVG